MKTLASGWRRTGQACGAAVAMLVLAGCAGLSPIESRKQQHADAYAALSPEFQTLVNAGQIKEGMNSDAVYIAWGPPSEVKRSDSASGPTEIWRYFGGYSRSVEATEAPVLMNPYMQNYTRAEVDFVNGLVTKWQTFPAPREL